MHLQTGEEKIKSVTGTVPGSFLFVDIAKQELHVVKDGKIAETYPVSTASKGIGNREGSFQTPRGVHRICEKYGRGAPVGRVFKDRIDTGETWHVGAPGENMVLTRILRLEGLEAGVNKGPGIDSYERYIYIHGTNNEGAIGSPFSQGCVCMRNHDVIRLFETVEEGAIVFID